MNELGFGVLVVWSTIAQDILALLSFPKKSLQVNE